MKYGCEHCQERFCSQKELQEHLERVAEELTDELDDIQRQLDELQEDL